MSRDHEEKGELGARSGHSRLLHDDQPRLGGEVHRAPCSGPACRASHPEVAESRRAGARAARPDGSGEPARGRDLTIAAAPSSRGWRPGCSPEGTALVAQRRDARGRYCPPEPLPSIAQVVQDGLETLYGAIDHGALAVRLPKHARKELEAYLGCGQLCRGFCRFRCCSCGESRLVGFSCKGRGFARRASAGG